MYLYELRAVSESVLSCVAPGSRGVLNVGFPTTIATAITTASTPRKINMHNDDASALILPLSKKALVEKASINVLL